MKNDQLRPVSVTMSPEMARRARVFAARQGISRSQLVREALERVLDVDGDDNQEAQYGSDGT